MKKWLIPFLLVFLYCRGNTQSNLRIGAPAPEITISKWLLNAPADTSLSGKYIVLEFWATWCIPCLQAVPHLNELQAKFPSPGLRFLSMTYEAPEVARKVFPRVDFHSIVVTDESSQTQINFGDGRQGLSYYPLTVLIDRENIVRWYGNPKDLDEAMMERFLNDKEVLPEATDEMQEPQQSPLPQITGLIDQKTFSDWFADSSIIWMVHLKGTMEQLEERPASLFLPGLTGGFDACISLEELFRKLFPHKRFVLPPSHTGRHFNFAYLNKKPSSDSERLLQSALLDSLNLDADTRLEPANHFIISVRNPVLMPPAPEARFSSYVFDDAGNLVFSKYTIADMLAVLSEQTDHEWTFQGTDRNKYAFVVNMSSEKAICQSLKGYGLKISKKKGMIETIYLSGRGDD